MAELSQALRDAANNLRTKVEAARARVADTPEQAELANTLNEIAGIADSIDPDNPAPGVGTGEGGEVVATDEQPQG